MVGRERRARADGFHIRIADSRKSLSACHQHHRYRLYQQGYREQEPHLPLWPPLYARTNCCIHLAGGTPYLYAPQRSGHIRPANGGKSMGRVAAEPDTDWYGPADAVWRQIALVALRHQCFARERATSWSLGQPAAGHFICYYYCPLNF